MKVVIEANGLQAHKVAIENQELQPTSEFHCVKLDKDCMLLVVQNRTNAPINFGLPHNVSFEPDVNQTPLPGQVELEDDVKYLHIGYDQAREIINRQSVVIKELRASVNYAHKRIDYLQDSLANLNKRVNRLPWYKRMNCFKKRK
jgi:hypothetical protein